MPRYGPISLRRNWVSASGNICALPPPLPPTDAWNVKMTEQLFILFYDWIVSSVYGSRLSATWWQMHGPHHGLAVFTRPSGVGKKREQILRQLRSFGLTQGRAVKKLPSYLLPVVAYFTSGQVGKRHRHFCLRAAGKVSLPCATETFSYRSSLPNSCRPLNCRRPFSVPSPTVTSIFARSLKVPSVTRERLVYF